MLIYQQERSSEAKNTESDVAVVGIVDVNGLKIPHGILSSATRSVPAEGSAYHNEGGLLGGPCHRGK